MENLKIYNLFNLKNSIASSFLASYDYPWEVFPNIKDFILKFAEKLDKNKFCLIGENVWAAKTAKICKNTFISGPAIIDEYSEIRFGTFIRGGVIIGKNTVVGNSTELKNCILFDKAQAPHFNYVGDSILGYQAHVGAGVVLSNFKSDKKNVVIKYKNLKIETGLRKIGAVLADNVEVGCNSVLNPGTIICKNSDVYPLTMVRGVVGENKILKNTGVLVDKI
jgi:NDP-sugar pyrophosphorylase family protein